MRPVKATLVNQGAAPTSRPYNLKIDSMLGSRSVTLVLRGTKLMARGRTLQVAALNISANPHPDGIYVDLLVKAAGKKTNYRGDSWAKFTKPKQVEGDSDLYVGRILIWTEINKDGAWLNDETDDFLSNEEKSEIQIPDKAKPNYRVFNYLFRQSTHRLYFEIRNEFSEWLGTTMAQSIFTNLLDRPAARRDIDLTVTVVPKRGAVSTVLKLPGLRQLHIRVIVPNDTTDEEKRRRVLDRLKKANAKQLDEIFTKRAGEDRLIATPEIQDTAEIAAENGFVQGVGRSNGKRVEASTTKQPRKETIPFDQPGASFHSRLVGSIGFF